MKLNFAFAFETEKQKYSVMFTMKDDNFKVIYILSIDARTAYGVVNNAEHLLNYMGLTASDVEIASFETLADANIFIMMMNQDDYMKGVEYDVVGCTAVAEHPNAHVEFYINALDGRDEDMVYFSRNHSYVKFKFEHMKYDAINGNEDVIMSAPSDFRLEMALVQPETDEQDYNHIDSEVIESFLLEEYEG
jgi:hypothetical protein